jgi:Zn finger protein HypA/HybF involved in hydrogenase expression
MAKVVYLHCMMCGHDYSETVEEGEDKERSCPKCRSNSIRVMKNPPKEE